jgi:hypothetical protein
MRHRAADDASGADLDLGQIERVEHQLNPLAGELRVDLVVVAVLSERPGPRDRPPLAPQERVA